MHIKYYLVQKCNIRSNIRINEILTILQYEITYRLFVNRYCLVKTFNIEQRE